MTSGFGDNIVDEIKSRCNIVDVIGRAIPLKRAGSSYKGVCPFHNEKTPSFVVSDTKQIFTCFGCGASGDIIEFVQRYYSLDFHGAIEKLAEEYGIEIKNFGHKKDERKQLLYELNREAAAFFYRCFKTNPNPGLSYMAGRGLNGPTLRDFGVGYADGSWDSLYNFLKEKGGDDSVLLELGLISESKGKKYDKFRDRVIFPIINTRGKVIGFGGRAIGDGKPKYLNSPESSIFLKKNNLYGLNLTRQEINKEDCAILVEGYMDVISLYQFGVRNVSASLGTALTENQAALLSRYTKNVIIAYDGDAAGQAAAFRGMDILHQAGLKVRVLDMGDSKDPDEFVRKHGKPAFMEIAAGALPFVEYKLYLLKKQTNPETTEGKIAYVKGAVEILSKLSPVEVDAYIKKIAADAKISENAIKLEINGKYSTEQHAPHPESLPETIEIPYWEQAEAYDEVTEEMITTGTGSALERSLIRLILARGGFLPRIIPYEDVFQTNACARIFSSIKNIYRDDEEIDLAGLSGSLDERERAILADILENIPLSDNEEKMFEDCIVQIQNERDLKRETEIRQMLSLSDDESEETVARLTKELMELQGRIFRE